LIDKNQVDYNHPKKAWEVDFEKLYQDHLPSEAVDLKDFVENLNSKNINKS